MEEERWVIEPPDVVGGMARLTLTLPALRAARQTLFLVSGAGKHDALSRVQAGEPLPSGMVTDADWLVDRAAVAGG
jgi:6-phosphogluconolactonase